MEKIVLLIALLASILLASALSPRAKQLSVANNAVRPKWSDLDVIGLCDGFRDNMSASAIADQLLRTEEDVRQKAEQLGLKLRAA